MSATAAIKRRRAALVAAVLYLGSAGAAPLVHAAVEASRATPAVERAHSDLCPRIHCEAACPSGATLLPPRAPAPTHEFVAAAATGCRPSKGVTPPRSSGTPPHAVRAPPAR